MQDIQVRVLLQDGRIFQIPVRGVLMTASLKQGGHVVRLVGFCQGGSLPIGEVASVSLRKPSVADGGRHFVLDEYSLSVAPDEGGLHVRLSGKSNQIRETQNEKQHDGHDSLP